MSIRLGSVLMLLFLSGFAGASTGRHDWRVVTAHPDFKISVCYPADLLQVRSRDDAADVALVGSGAIAIFNAKSDKDHSLREEMRESMNVFLNPPELGSRANPNPTGNTFQAVRIKSRAINSDYYIYVAENDTAFLIDWGIHVDRAIKQMLISYPKYKVTAWKGVA